MARLQIKYFEEIVPKLKVDLGYKSVMQVPRLQKICINRGEGAAVHDKKRVNAAVDDLTAITGQKAVATLAKQSISNFKLREGMPIGARVTLRGVRMYEFMDRLITLALPRIRDFRGISPSGFDKKGSYNLGLKEQVIFPEINFDSIQKIAGMNVTFVTTANTPKEAYMLLKSFGMPFREK